MITDRAYHDTYYVVAHANYVLSLVVFTAVVAAIWLAISRLTPGQFRRLRAVAAFSWVAGLLLVCGLPLLVMYLSVEVLIDRPELFSLINTASVLGALLTAVCFVISLIALVLAVLRRLRS